MIGACATRGCLLHSLGCSPMSLCSKYCSLVARGLWQGGGGPEVMLHSMPAQRCQMMGRKPDSILTKNEKRQLLTSREPEYRRCTCQTSWVVACDRVVTTAGTLLDCQTCIAGNGIDALAGG